MTDTNVPHVLDLGLDSEGRAGTPFPAAGRAPNRLRIIARLALCLGAALAWPLATATGADEPAATPAAPLDFQLFIGLDVYVQAGDEIGRVRQITRGKAEVVMGETARTFPLRKLATKRFDHLAKVSATQMTIQHARGECVPTELNASMYDVVIDQASRELEAGQEKRRDDDTAAFYEGMYNPENQAAKEQERARQEMNARAMALMPRADADLFSQDRFLDLEHQEAAANSDTLKVSFAVSAPQPMTDACVIVFAVLRHPVDPRAAIHRVLMSKLPALGVDPVTVKLQRTGLPRGCVVETLGVHVYARGRELGSNVARGRVNVTREEAVRFLRLQHLNVHAGQTRPPELLADFLPAAVATIVPADQRERTARLTVDAQGDVVAVVLERRKQGPADARIEALLRAVPFLPALEAGAPIVADCTMPLRDFIP